MVYETTGSNEPPEEALGDVPTLPELDSNTSQEARDALVKEHPELKDIFDLSDASKANAQEMDKSIAQNKGLITEEAHSKFEQQTDDLLDKADNLAGIDSKTESETERQERETKELELKAKAAFKPAEAIAPDKGVFEKAQSDRKERIQKVKKHLQDQLLHKYEGKTAGEQAGEAIADALNILLQSLAYGPKVGLAYRSQSNALNPEKQKSKLKDLEKAFNKQQKKVDSLKEKEAKPEKIEKAEEKLANLQKEVDNKKEHVSQVEAFKGGKEKPEPKPEQEKDKEEKPGQPDWNTSQETRDQVAKVDPMAKELFEAAEETKKMAADKEAGKISEEEFGQKMEGVADKVEKAVGSGTETQTESEPQRQEEEAKEVGKKAKAASDKKAVETKEMGAEGKGKDKKEKASPKERIEKSKNHFQDQLLHKYESKTEGEQAGEAIADALNLILQTLAYAGKMGLAYRSKSNALNVEKQSKSLKEFKAKREKIENKIKGLKTKKNDLGEPGSDKHSQNQKKIAKIDEKISVERKKLDLVEKDIVNQENYLSKLRGVEKEKQEVPVSETLEEQNRRFNNACAQIRMQNERIDEMIVEHVKKEEERRVELDEMKVGKEKEEKEKEYRQETQRQMKEQEAGMEAFRKEVEASDKAAKELDKSIDKEIKKTDAALQKNQKEISKLQNEIKKDEKLNKKDRKEMSNLENKISTNKLELKKTEDELKKIADKKQANKMEVASLENECKQNELNLRNSEAKLNALNKEGGSTGEINAQTRKVEKDRKEAEKSREMLDEKKLEGAEISKDEKAKVKERDKQLAENKSLESRKNGLERKVEKREAKVDRAQKKLEGKKREGKKIEAQQKLHQENKVLVKSRQEDIKKMAEQRQAIDRKSREMRELRVTENDPGKSENERKKAGQDIKARENDIKKHQNEISQSQGKLDKKNVKLQENQEKLNKLDEDKGHDKRLKAGGDKEEKVDKGPKSKKEAKKEAPTEMKEQPKPAKGDEGPPKPTPDQIKMAEGIEKSSSNIKEGLEKVLAKFNEAKKEDGMFDMKSLRDVGDAIKMVQQVFDMAKPKPQGGKDEKDEKDTEKLGEMAKQDKGPEAQGMLTTSNVFEMMLKIGSGGLLDFAKNRKEAQDKVSGLMEQSSMGGEAPGMGADAGLGSKESAGPSGGMEGGMSSGPGGAEGGMSSGPGGAEGGGAPGLSSLMPEGSKKDEDLYVMGPDGEAETDMFGDKKVDDKKLGQEMGKDFAKNTAENVENGMDPQTAVILAAVQTAMKYADEIKNMIRQKMTAGLDFVQGFADALTKGIEEGMAAANKTPEEQLADKYQAKSKELEALTSEATEGLTDVTEQASQTFTPLNNMDKQGDPSVKEKAAPEQKAAPEEPGPGATSAPKPSMGR